jgi:hypothetical protein
MTMKSLIALALLVVSGAGAYAEGVYCVIPHGENYCKCYNVDMGKTCGCGGPCTGQGQR